MIHTEVVQYKTEKQYLKDARKRARRRRGGWKVVSVVHEKVEVHSPGVLIFLLGKGHEKVLTVTYEREGR